MQFYSTNNPSQTVDFKEAVFNSFPADKGLYMPENIPQLNNAFLKNIEKYSLQEIAFEVTKTLLTGSIPDSDLRFLINDAINFPAPLKELDDKTYVLELFHGPSLAFKDFGARFMSRVMSYYLKDDEQILDVLVATSGDTGGAVALGFLGVPNTRVTILYPKGKVSEIQELQLTTNGQNIRAIEVDGTFDDCQALVKQAFTDADLNRKLRLTSANSINIARLIPQMFYYFNAYAELKRAGKTDIIFSIPSGNFGNMAAGLLAWKMGLPVKQFLAATNANDTVPRFLQTGTYNPKKSVQTISNAMDVGSPSNWARIVDLFKENPDQLKNIITGFNFTDEETVKAISRIFEKFNYVVCPHTAIAWLAFAAWQTNRPNDESTGVFLSTAHACKFPDVFADDIFKQVVVQEQVRGMASKNKLQVSIGNDFESFKEYLLNK